jgi:hypothetical protein
MNRRELIIAAASFPLLKTFGRNSNALNSAGCAQMKFGELRIILDGPFAVVLKTDFFGNVVGVVAFSPIEPSDAHHFFLNGAEQAHTGKFYHFSLTATNTNGLNPPLIPDYIDPGFGDFDVEKRTTWKDLNDYFVYLDLPCPNRIIFTDTPATVTLKNDPQHMFRQMPVNHILLYDVRPQNGGIPIGCQELGEQCPTEDGTFVLEVGLGLRTPHSDQHALDFFNNTILPHFPDIKDDKTLDSLKLDLSAQKKKTLRKLVPPASDVECKNGGIIVTV